MTLKWPKAKVAAGTSRLFPVLGIAVIAICLLAGFAHAAEATGEESCIIPMSLSPDAVSLLTHLHEPVDSESESAGQSDNGWTPCDHKHAQVGCYAELEHNGYWYTKYIGSARAECASPRSAHHCVAINSMEACNKAFPGYDIVDVREERECGKG